MLMVRSIYIILGMVLLGMPNSCATLYVLDKTFGKNGIAHIDTDQHAGSYNIYIPDVHGAMQSDGKIVVVGTCYKAHQHELHYPQAQIIVARYNSDGSPDASFGRKGCSILPLSQKNSFGMDLSIQKSGKIIIAGRRFDRGDWLGEAILTRIHHDGTLDTSFGDNGVAQLSSVGLDYSNFFRVKLRTDDTIVACGNWGSYRLLSNHTVHNSGSFIHQHVFERSGFCTAQFTADGAPDQKFGNRGVVITYLHDSARTKLRVPGKEDDNAHSLYIQPDGNIVVVGGMADGSDPNLLLVEEIPVSHSTGLTEELPAQVISHTTDCAIVRYDAMGRLDTTFGLNGTGIVMTSASEKYNAYLDCTLQPDNKIVALGVARDALRHVDQFLLVRYLPNGMLDQSFGVQGIVTISPGTGKLCPKNIALQHDGKIVVTGIVTWGKHKKFTIIRYNTDGSYDDACGEQGCMELPIGSCDDRSIALIPHNNDLFVVGDSYDGTKYRMTVAKLTSEPKSLKTQTQCCETI